MLKNDRKKSKKTGENFRGGGWGEFFWLARIYIPVDRKHRVIVSTTCIVLGGMRGFPLVAHQPTG